MIKPETLVPYEYNGSLGQRESIEYGKYLVVRKDGLKYIEVFNGSSWAYNDNTILFFYLPKLN